MATKTRTILPNAESIVRAVLVQSIEDRFSRLDTLIDLGSARQLAAQLTNPGSYPPITLVEKGATQTPSADSGLAVRGIKCR